MKRRAFLATSAVATAGIVGGCTTETEPRGETSPSTTTNSESLQRQITLTNIDEVQDKSLNIDATLLTKQVDESSTARLKVTTTNTGERRYIRIHPSSGCCVFNGEDGGSEPRGLWLYHTDDVPVDKKEGKWTATKNGPTETDRVWGDGACGPEIYEQDEMISNEYELWDDYMAEEYFPTGTYRFEGDFSIWESDERRKEDRSKITWGFSIEVAK